MRSRSLIPLLFVLALSPRAMAMDYTVTTAAATGTGSFIEALGLANGNGGPDRILFNIPGAGVHTISLTGIIRITDDTIIDGYSQPGTSRNTLTNGMNAVLLIEIDGTGVTQEGIEIFTGTSTITGLVVTGFPVRGIGVRTSNNVIEGNIIGLDPTGATSDANGVGVVIVDGEFNRVGGAASGQRNLIGGNQVTDIMLLGGASCRVVGNHLGIDAAGTTAMPSSVGVYNPTCENTVIVGNVISGHARTAVTAEGGAIGMRIIGNKIGTDPTGMMAIPNVEQSIVLLIVDDVEIGGPGEGEGNLISGNLQDGIALGNSTHVVIQGNKIGTDITGTQPLPNGANGFGSGVSGGYGVTIGGINPGEANIIAYNIRSGVYLFGSREVNLVRGNAIFGNLVHEIELNADRTIDHCDVDMGFNGAQNPPTITAVSIDNGMVTVTADLDSTASTHFDVDVFGSRACRSGTTDLNGPAEWYLGSVEIDTDATCQVTYQAMFTLPSPDLVAFTETVTSPEGTSELSNCIAIGGTPADAGPGDVGEGTIEAGVDGGVDSGVALDASTPADTGTDELDTVKREDKDGCTCNLATTGPANLLAVLGLALLFRVRRRRR